MAVARQTRPDPALVRLSGPPSWHGEEAASAYIIYTHDVHEAMTTTTAIPTRLHGDSCTETRISKGPSAGVSECNRADFNCSQELGPHWALPARSESTVSPACRDELVFFLSRRTAHAGLSGGASVVLTGPRLGGLAALVQSHAHHVAKVWGRWFPPFHTSHGVPRMPTRCDLGSRPLLLRPHGWIWGTRPGCCRTVHLVAALPRFDVRDQPPGH